MYDEVWSSFSSGHGLCHFGFWFYLHDFYEQLINNLFLFSLSITMYILLASENWRSRGWKGEGCWFSFFDRGNLLMVSVLPALFIVISDSYNIVFYWADFSHRSCWCDHYAGENNNRSLVSSTWYIGFIFCLHCRIFI